MKMSKVVSVSVFIAVSMLMLTGCSMFSKKPVGSSAKNAPPPPPPVVVVPRPAPVMTPDFSGVNPRAPAIGPFDRSRPRWIHVSVFDSVINARSGAYVSTASVVVTNKRKERVVLQVGDRLLGVPDDNRVVGVMVLPPGESFTVNDLGLGQKTNLKALILNDKDERIGYIAVTVTWPQGWSQIGGETSWDLVAVNAAGIDPMVPLPMTTLAGAVPIVTPIP